MIAGVLELADEVDSKSIASNGVRVQVPPPALEVNSPQFPDISGSCGLFLFYGKEHPIEYPFWEDRPRRRRKCCRRQPAAGGGNAELLLESSLSEVQKKYTEYIANSSLQMQN